MITRRGFLKGAGAGLGLSPFGQLLFQSAARAQSVSRPQRLIGIYHPHGAASPLFTMKSGESETNFSLAAADSVLSPFDDPATYGRSFKDKLVILEGVDLAAAIKGGTSGHSAPASILTGWGGAPRGPSIDQYLAVDRGLGAMTPVTSLVLAVGSRTTSNDECISFSGNGAPLTKITQPALAFDAAFAQIIAGQDPAAAAALASKQRAERSVLDFIKGDLGRISPRLGSSERSKLDQHLTSIRELEKAVDALTHSAGGGSCTAPARPTVFERSESYNGGEPFFDEITNLQIEIIALTMACDVTRFATLWLADLSRGAGAAVGLAVPEDCHNALAHTYDGPRGNHYGSGASPGNADTWTRLGVQHRYSYGKAARLLMRLDQLGLLDDVVLFMSSDMGDPAAHSSRNVPMLLAGGGAPSWRLGRRLKMADDCPPDRWYCDPPSLVPHNQVLVSIAQAFGLADVTTFGDPSLASGPISGLT